jgi:hypothetical protein
MPRLLDGVPRYRKHRASGQAIVNLSGIDFYLGPHGTKVSHQEYDRVVAEWLARGRTLPASDPSADHARPITLVEVTAAYKRYARDYYRKRGRVTNEYTAICSAMKVAQELYGRQSAAEFGPLKLQAVQQRMVQLDWSRKHINKQVSRLIRMFRWAASQELVPGQLPFDLRQSRDYPRVEPVLGCSGERTGATYRRRDRQQDPAVPFSGRRGRQIRNAAAASAGQRHPVRSAPQDPAGSRRPTQ